MQCHVKKLKIHEDMPNCLFIVFDHSSTTVQSDIGICLSIGVTEGEECNYNTYYLPDGSINGLGVT